MQNNIEKRIERSLSFLKDNAPGKILFLRSDIGIPGFEGHWLKLLMNEPVENLLDKKIISKHNDEFLSILRSKSNKLNEMEDDVIPTVEIYFSIGSITAMMSNENVMFSSGTGWCEPSIKDIDDIENIKFNPDNPWVRFHEIVSQDMINKWEGDFTLIPCFHRSPLDSANGVRGDRIFYDMYDSPEATSELIMACADWSLAMEEYLSKELSWPNGLKRGTWGVALPDGAVFVNGDPADMISVAQQQMFERPACEKLFTNTGGGFFHHHAMGTGKVDVIAQTHGMLIQNIFTDPNYEVPAYAMVEDIVLCEKITDASMITPIYLNGDFLSIADKLLPILSRGRFILRQDDTKNARKALDKFEVYRN